LTLGFEPRTTAIVRVPTAIRATAMWSRSRRFDVPHSLQWGRHVALPHLPLAARTIGECGFFKAEWRLSTADALPVHGGLGIAAANVAIECTQLNSVRLDSGYRVTMNF
jgi:hypothetical protein